MSLVYGDDSREAMQRITSQGFSEWSHGGTEVILPKDVSSVSSEVLADLLSRITAWLNYAAMQFAAAQVDEAALERKRDMLYAKAMSSRGSVRGEKVTVLKAQAASDPQIEKVDNDLAQAYAYRKMMEVVYNNYERESFLISREITRRTSDQRALRKDRFTS
jgi:hypothetical protein